MSPPSQLLYDHRIDDIVHLDGEWEELVVNSSLFDGRADVVAPVHIQEDLRRNGKECRVRHDKYKSVNVKEERDGQW